MEPVTYLWIGLAVGWGSFVQGAVGFAFGIFSIPLLVWAGLPLENAIALVLSLVAVQTATCCWQYRREIPWRDVLTLSAYRFCAVPIGVTMLRYARVSLPNDRIKQGVGIMLLVAVGIQLLCRPRPRARLAHGWSVLAGTTSGIFAGLVGMGGPPVVLWAMAHDWPTLRARTCLWMMFLLMAPWQLSVSMWQFGPATIGHSVLVGLAYTPLVMLMSYTGARAGSHFSTTLLRKIVYGLLVLIGVTSCLGPYF